MSELLTAALTYQKRGLSVIPIQAREKKPLVAWEEYQTRGAAEEEITAWWTKWPELNVGIVTGAVSGLVVIDLDTVGAKDKLRDLVPGFDFSAVPRSRTGNGWQIFFKHPGVPITNRAGVLTGLDVRGDGGYAEMVAMWSRRCRVIRTPKPSGAKPGLGPSIRSFNGAWVNESIGRSSPRGGNCDHAVLV